MTLALLDGSGVEIIEGDQAIGNMDFALELELMSED